jgi:hypothetical protein
MRKSEQVCARVTPDVMTSLRALAGRQSILLSEFIRQTLAEKVSRLTTGEVSEVRFQGHSRHGGTCC